MKRRKMQRPEHESPHEQRLREIVDEFVPECPEKQAYLAFARELARAEHHARLTADERRWTQMQDPDSSESRDQKPECRIPGYPSEAVKRVVMKWFRRGLHGNLLWLVGGAILRGR